MPDEILIRFSVKDDGSPVIERVNNKIKETKSETQAMVPGLEKARQSITGFIGQNAALIGVLTGVAVALKKSVDAAAEAQIIDAQLEAVLRSTAGAAGLQKDELDELATSLSRISVFDDETIKKNEALMLTFTKIGRDVFPDAMEAALNMSAALGQDLQSSVVQLGKALNDPIRGVTALSRVGVSFTKDQMAMIKSLVESGNTLEAQKMILKELSTEFGGQAKAAADTYTGQMTQLKNEIGNLQEAIGEGLLPDLTKMVSELKDATIWITENIDEIRKWGNILTWAGMPAVRLGQLVSKLRREHEEAKDATDEMKDSTQQLPAAFDAATAALEENEEELKQQEEAMKKLSEANQAYLSLVGDITSQHETYSQTVEDLNKEHEELLAEKQKLIDQGYGVESQTIAEVNAKLAENEEAQRSAAEEFELAGRKRILSMLEQQLAIDGLDKREMEYLLGLGLQWGVYSQSAVDAAKAAMDEVASLQSAIEQVPEEKSVRISVYTDLQGTDYWNSEKGGGRASGGPVSGGMMYPVNERGMPELLNMGNQQYLMMPPGTNGMVTPMGTGGGGAGGSGVVVNIMLSDMSPDPERVAYQIAPAVRRVLRQEGISV